MCVWGGVSWVLKLNRAKMRVPCKGRLSGEARVRPTGTPAFSEGWLSPQQRIWGLEECFEVSKLTWSLLQMLRQALIYGTRGHCLDLRLLLCLPRIGSLICPSPLLRL